MATAADHIVATLAASGVQRVFGIPGDSLNGFTDSLRREGEIDWVHVRHEETAAFAASAEAALTGELAVCAGSCGPGNLHLINGLYDAHRSRVPVLAIAAQIPSDEIGSNYFQETRPEQLFDDCSVFATQVTDAAQVPRMLRLAMRAAVQQRGVAVLIIPGDIALADLNVPAQTVVAAESVTTPSAADLTRAASVLNAAKTVTILAGAGCAGAHAELLQIAERLQAPVVHALRGKEHVEPDNPYDVGMTGLLGFTSGYRAMESADTLLVLGSDMPYQQFYPEVPVVQVDLRGENLGRRTPIEVGLVGDVGSTVSALLPLLDADRSSTHLDRMTKHYARARKDLDELAEPSKPGQPIHPQYLTRLLDQAADDDAIFLPDVGSPVVWAARYLRLNGLRRLIGSFSHGSMANALTQAIGAQTVDRQRQVVAMSGDGGLTMMLGELITLTQNQLPVKVVVYNNSSLNFVELEMKAAGFVNFGTDLENPDFSAMAQAMGIRGIRVTESADLPAAVKDFLAHDEPAVLDVVTERQELSMPPSITAAQAKGFALYAIRTVLSGRGDELIDLAKANLRQIF